MTVVAVGILLAATSVEFLRFPHYPLKEMLPYLLLVFVVLLGVGMSNPAGDYQALKMRDFFFLTGAIVACIPVVIRDVRDLRGLVFAWLAGGLIAAGAVLLVGGSETLYGRSGIGESTLGPAYVAAGGLIAAVTAWGERYLDWRSAVPAVALTGPAVMAIGSRGPLLSAVGGIAAWTLMRGLPRRRSALAGAALGVTILLGVREAPDESLSRLFLYEDAARESLWATAWSTFLEHPILGVGWGDFATVSGSEYPHNAMLEVAAELGLLGLAAFIGLLVASALRTWRSRTTGEARVLGAVAMAALIGQQFSSDLTNRNFWIAVVPTLLFASLLRRTQTNGVMAGGGRDPQPRVGAGHAAPMTPQDHRTYGVPRPAGLLPRGTHTKQVCKPEP